MPGRSCSGSLRPISARRRWRRAARRPWRPASSATPSGCAWLRRHRTWSWCPSRGSSRSSAGSRSLQSWSASAQPAPWLTRRLASTLADIRVGVSEHELALALEWRMRTGGAEGLAFDVACLSGPRAALPHGSPGERTVRSGEVLLFDFGARVDGYRSDMTRTLFVGEPTAARPGHLRARRAGPGGGHRAAPRGDPGRAQHHQPGGGRRRPRRHRGRRPGSALRARHGPRHRPGHPRAALAWAAPPRRSRCPRRRSSRSSPASTSTASRASASRTSWPSTTPRGSVELLTALPARGHGRRGVAPAPLESGGRGRRRLRPAQPNGDTRPS